MPQPTTGILIALQCFVVAFVGLHNWIPLGSLNDLRAVRAEFPGSKLFLTTLSNFIPAAFGLACSLYFQHRFPEWLIWYLWIFYLLAGCGSAYGWWIPYGVRPNTLHVIFDFATLAVLATLATLGAQRG
jgi:hypothetical protein